VLIARAHHDPDNGSSTAEADAFENQKNIRRDFSRLQRDMNLRSGRPSPKVGRKIVPQRVHRDDLIKATASAALRQMLTIVFVAQDSEIKDTIEPVSNCTAPLKK
jgi:hypothetical protein